jgi:hypothetical protein
MVLGVAGGTVLYRVGAGCTWTPASYYLGVDILLLAARGRLPGGAAVRKCMDFGERVDGFQWRVRMDGI